MNDELRVTAEPNLTNPHIKNSYRKTQKAGNFMGQRALWRAESNKWDKFKA